MLAYACTIFLSAFLLFAVQPMIGKIILPWFGGSAAVWSTCLLFFQAALLAGYLYAHWSTRWLKPKRQAMLHIALMAVSLALLPILPSPRWKPSEAGDPSLRILLLLAVTIGLPYILLSTTSPLLQAWYVAAKPGAIPYRLFALSNFGSLLALLSYPVLVEPVFTTHAQANGWSGIYVVFALACATIAWSALRASSVAAHLGHARPLDRALGVRLHPAACHHESLEPERRAHSVSLGAAAQRLSAQLHSVLRTRERLSSRHLSSAVGHRTRQRGVRDLR
jgi:Na+/melibiose symporter-like transporter